MDEQSKKVLRQYTADAASILKHSIRLMDSGETGFYRVAAVQLRILLCDTTFRHNRTEDIAVLPILFPNLLLPALTSAASGTTTQLPLGEWLDQPAEQGSTLSVRQMIRRICDIDGGAHIDPKPVSGLPQGFDQAEWIQQVSKLLLPELEKSLGD